MNETPITKTKPKKKKKNKKNTKKIFGVHSLTVKVGYMD